MVRLYERGKVPEILRDRMDGLSPILKYFQDRGYILRYAPGRVSLISRGTVVEFYLNQEVRAIGREHLVSGHVRTGRRGTVNGGRNFTVDTRNANHAIAVIETGENPHVLGFTEEIEIYPSEP